MGEREREGGGRERERWAERETEMGEERAIGGESKRKKVRERDLYHNISRNI